MPKSRKTPASRAFTRPDDSFLREKNMTVSRLGGTPVRRILSNFGWLGLERLIRNATSLVVAVWIARHLGPERFGLLNYAQSVVAVILPMAGYGLAGIVVRDLVLHPATRDDLLSATLILRAAGAAVALILTLGFAAFFARDKPELMALVLVLSTASLALLADTIECDYQARLQNGYLVAIKTLFFALSTLAKILLLVAGSGVFWFAVVMAAESLAIALGLWALSWRQGRGFHFRFNRDMVMHLLRQGWLFFWVAMIGSLYRRLDQLLLGTLAEAHDLGVYAAAWKILEALSYGPTLAVTALAPVFSAAYRESGQAFRSSFMRATRWLFWSLCLVSLVAVLISHFLMPWALGHQYSGSAQVFTLLGGLLPVFALNLLGIQWATQVHRGDFLVEQGLAGLLVCLGFGIVLIPAHGYMGAAISVVASQIFATLIYGWFRPVGREILLLQVRAVAWGRSGPG